MNQKHVEILTKEINRTHLLLENIQYYPALFDDHLITFNEALSAMQVLADQYEQKLEKIEAKYKGAIELAASLQSRIAHLENYIQHLPSCAISIYDPEECCLCGAPEINHPNGYCYNIHFTEPTDNKFTPYRKPACTCGLIQNDVTETDWKAMQQGREGLNG